MAPGEGAGQLHRLSYPPDLVLWGIRATLVRCEPPSNLAPSSVVWVLQGAEHKQCSILGTQHQAHETLLQDPLPIFMLASGVINLWITSASSFWFLTCVTILLSPCVLKYLVWFLFSWLDLNWYSKFIGSCNLKVQIENSLQAQCVPEGLNLIRAPFCFLTFFQHWSLLYVYCFQDGYLVGSKNSYSTSIPQNQKLYWFWGRERMPLSQISK